MKINFLSRSIELTAKEMREASKPYTREYSDLIRLMRELPDYEITVKHRYCATSANRGLTYEYMERYIAEHAPERMNEFTFIRTTSGYPTTTKWFRIVFQDEMMMVGLCTAFGAAA